MSDGINHDFEASLKKLEEMVARQAVRTGQRFEIIDEVKYGC